MTNDSGWPPRSTTRQAPEFRVAWPPRQSHDAGGEGARRIRLRTPVGSREAVGGGRGSRPSAVVRGGRVGAAPDRICDIRCREFFLPKRPVGLARSHSKEARRGGPAVRGSSPPEVTSSGVSRASHRRAAHRASSANFMWLDLGRYNTPVHEACCAASSSP